MNELLKYAATNRIVNGRNKLLKKSLEKGIMEDKEIKIVTKEVTDLIVRSYKYKMYIPKINRK